MPTWYGNPRVTSYESHIDWRGVRSVQGGILVDYDQLDAHVLKWNPDKFGYPQSLHARAAHAWDIPSKLKFYAIYPSMAILASRQFRAAYWLITTKTLAVGGTLLTQKFQLSQWPRNYVIPYMWKSCSWPTPYRPHIDWRVSCQFRAAYWLITTKLIHMSWSEILTSLVILHIRAPCDWNIPSKLRFDAIYPSVGILASTSVLVWGLTRFLTHCPLGDLN